MLGVTKGAHEKIRVLLRFDPHRKISGLKMYNHRGTVCKEIMLTWKGQLHPPCLSA
jgi:hypothetical protein